MKKFFLRGKNRWGDSSESEIEQLASELISETTGEEGILKKKFDKLIAGYNSETNPIGEDEARRILFVLLKEASSKRRQLAGRISKDVENGNLFDRYYGKLQVINALTNSAYAKFQKMDTVKERYDYKLKVYYKSRKKGYESDVVPTDSDKVKKMSLDDISDWADKL